MRPGMLRRHSVLVVWLWGALLACASGHGQSAVVNCGVESLRGLAELLAVPVDGPTMKKIIAGLPVAGPSMQDISRTAVDLGISLLGVQASLDALAGVRGPCIIHINDPGHFVVMSRAAGDWVQLVEYGQVTAIARSELAKHYSGHALILDQDTVSGGPVVGVDEFHYRFGVSGLGQDVAHSFRVRNRGNEDLEIAAQPAGCRGPRVSIDRGTLRPGQSANVTVAFKINETGPIVRLVKLLTSDPLQPIVFLGLQGTVPHDVQACPERLYFRGANGDTPCRVVRVWGPAEMGVDSVVCDTGSVDVHVGEPVVGADNRKMWRIALTLRKRPCLGKFGDRLTIHTTHKDRPVITIPIVGEMVSDIDVRPSGAFFGFVRLGQALTAQIGLCSRSEAAFTIKSATCSLPEVGIGALQQRDGKWFIPVTVDAVRPGVIDTFVAVTTDVPGQSSLHIPIYAQVLGR